jgi:hypothetical protein
MSDSLQLSILRTFFYVAKPIARALLSSGIGFREFSDYAKTIFVDVAAKEYGSRGRPTNTSRVSAMTGIARKQVAIIKSRDLVALDEPSKLSPPGEVLHLWFTAPEFLNQQGEPKDLPVSGPVGSFESLVSKGAGDIPPGAMRTELLRFGSIEQLPDGKLRVLSRSFVPPNLSDRLESGLCFGYRQLAEMILENALVQGGGARSQLKLYEFANLNPEQLEEFQKLSMDSLNQFGGEFDDFLAGMEGPRTESESSIGVGLFYFEKNSISDEPVS